MSSGELSPALERQPIRSLAPEQKRKRGRPAKRKISTDEVPCSSPIRPMVAGSGTALLQDVGATVSPIRAITSPIDADKDDDDSDGNFPDRFDSFLLPLNETVSENEDDQVFGPQPDRGHLLRRQAMNSSRIKTEKTSRESMAQFLAHECDCGLDCTAHFSRSQIQPLRDATYDAESTNGGPEHCRRILKSMKVLCPITQRQKFHFVVCNRTVCEQVCSLAHGATPSSWRRGKQAATNDLESVPKKRKI